MSNLRVYTVVCPKCDSVIHIEQKGCDIEKFLDEILDEIHIKNTFDSFVSYFPKKEKTNRVDIEITNKVCCPEGWEMCSTGALEACSSEACSSGTS